MTEAQGVELLAKLDRIIAVNEMALQWSQATHEAVRYCFLALLCVVFFSLLAGVRRW